MQTLFEGSTSLPIGASSFACRARARGRSTGRRLGRATRSRSPVAGRTKQPPQSGLRGRQSTRSTAKLPPRPQRCGAGSARSRGECGRGGSCADHLYGVSAMTSANTRLNRGICSALRRPCQPILGRNVFTATPRPVGVFFPAQCGSSMLQGVLCQLRV